VCGAGWVGVALAWLDYKSWRESAPHTTRHWHGRLSLFNQMYFSTRFLSLSFTLKAAELVWLAISGRKTSFVWSWNCQTHQWSGGLTVFHVEPSRQRKSAQDVANAKDATAPPCADWSGSVFWLHEPRERATHRLVLRLPCQTIQAAELAQGGAVALSLKCVSDVLCQLERVHQ